MAAVQVLLVALLCSFSYADFYAFIPYNDAADAFGNANALEGNADSDGFSQTDRFGQARAFDEAMSAGIHPSAMSSANSISALNPYARSMFPAVPVQNAAPIVPAVPVQSTVPILPPVVVPPSSSTGNAASNANAAVGQTQSASKTLTNGPVSNSAAQGQSVGTAPISNSAVDSQSRSKRGFGYLGIPASGTALATGGASLGNSFSHGNSFSGNGIARSDGDSEASGYNPFSTVVANSQSGYRRRRAASPDLLNILSENSTTVNVTHVVVQNDPMNATNMSNPTPLVISKTENSSHMFSSLESPKINKREVVVFPATIELMNSTTAAVSQNDKMPTSTNMPDMSSSTAVIVTKVENSSSIIVTKEKVKRDVLIGKEALLVPAVVNVPRPIGQGVMLHERMMATSTMPDMMDNTTATTTIIAFIPDNSQPQQDMSAVAPDSRALFNNGSDIILVSTTVNPTGTPVVV